MPSNNAANIQNLTILLYSVFGIIFLLICAIVGVYLNVKIKESKKLQEEKKNQITQQNNEKKTIKTFNVASVFDFMEFDRIEDNMIVQKKGMRYVMVVECQGINYDLMSQNEKVAVEEGFIQFLNTLSHSVQIYTQTRKINLENSLQTYKSQVDKIEQDYTKAKIRYQNVMQSSMASEQQKKRALYEVTRAKNLYEYGKDIIYNTERMSLNKNILNKKYYIAIPYFSEEGTASGFAKEEISELAFSELYTRAQSIIRAISVSGVIGKVLTSTELADLLYFAYNRDEAEVYGVDKAIKAGYNEIYKTAPDVMEKKIELLDEEIERQATRLANEKVKEVQSEKEKEYRKKYENEDDLINNLAQLIIKENEAMLGKDVAEKAKAKVREEKK